MIMKDYKNSKPTEEKLTAWGYIGAVSFSLLLIALIFLATI